MGQRVQFLEFTFDLQTGELSSARETVRLQPQPAAALRVLLSSAGELVTRDALKQAIWPDTVVEADQGLNFCIRQIRMALGDDADGGRFIETLPRRGYRFIPEVREVSATTPMQNDSSRLVAQPVSPSDLTAPSKSRTKFVVVAMMIAVAIAAFVWSARTKVIDVALLPLASNGATDQWALETDRLVTDGLVEALTNLESLKLGVHGPATTSPFAGSAEPQTEIGRKLDVQYVLSGGVRLSDSTLFVQAVRVTDGRHVFAWRQSLGGRSASELAGLIAREFAARITTETP